MSHNPLHDDPSPDLRTITREAHYARVTELLEHNNDQLEENRAQRRQIKALKSSIKSALDQIHMDGVDDGFGRSTLETALAIGPITDGDLTDKAGEFAERVVRGLREDLDDARVRHETNILSDAILTWLKDEKIA